ncbi:FMN-binding protein [Ktedonospora formicarum]|uniref:FMN-binding protein n=1 Tax=Ktedonospora formicarum TaxID=2778364 RepID=UPI001C68EEB5|nr:FMN-binding protein [Ktedonospora formicarum]
MKKFTLAALIIVAFILYSLLYRHSNDAAIVPNSVATSKSSSSSSSTGTATTTPNVTTTPDATTTLGALYKDGSYTGSVADAHWGNVQVKVVIQNGKITDVSFLQYPNERSRSVMINEYADPQLSSEAIQAQSANVDIVTGATDTSEAFMQSLADALSQAKG